MRVRSGAPLDRDKAILQLLGKLTGTAGAYGEVFLVACHAADRRHHGSRAAGEAFDKAAGV